MGRSGKLDLSPFPHRAPSWSQPRVRWCRWGLKAPDFSLPDTNGKTVSLADFADAPALLVVFMCNHCPFVKHVADGLAAARQEYQTAAWPWWASTPTTWSPIPTIRRDKMADESQAAAATRFPYLYDETQEVAKAYQAACTPDFYVFDQNASWSIAARWTAAGRATTFR